jgi:hypothetical protein
MGIGVEETTELMSCFFSCVKRTRTSGENLMAQRRNNDPRGNSRVDWLEISHTKKNISLVVKVRAGGFLTAAVCQESEKGTGLSGYGQVPASVWLGNCQGMVEQDGWGARQVNGPPTVSTWQPPRPQVIIFERKKMSIF